MFDVAIYVLVLVSALSHAVWNALLKASGDRLVTLTGVRITGLLLGLACLTIADLPSIESWPWLAAALVALYVYQALLLLGYETSDLSYVYPLARGLSPLLVTVLAIAVANETPSFTQGIGVMFVCCGLLVLVWKGGGGSTGTLAAIAIAVTVASYSFSSGMGVRHAASLLGFSAVLEIGCGVGVIAYAGATRGRHLVAALKRSWPSWVGAGCLAWGGFLVYLLATSRLPLGPVTALRESSSLFGVLIGTFLLREGFGLRRAFAASVMTAGIALIFVWS